MRACQTCGCEQQLGCLDLSGAEVRGPGAQEPSVCLGSLWEPCPTRSDPTEPKSEKAKKRKSELCRTNANAGGGTRTPDTDYDSARIPSVYGRFGHFWTANWTVLSGDLHGSRRLTACRAGCFHGAGRATLSKARTSASRSKCASRCSTASPPTSAAAISASDAGR